MLRAARAVILLIGSTPERRSEGAPRATENALDVRPSAVLEDLQRAQAQRVGLRWRGGRQKGRRAGGNQGGGGDGQRDGGEGRRQEGRPETVRDGRRTAEGSSRRALCGPACC